MKKLIALLLCFVMVACFMAGCGADEKEKANGVVGTWVCDMPMPDADTMLAGMEAYYDPDDIRLTFVLTFAEDGTYEMYVDEDSIDDLVDVICKATEKFTDELAGSMGMSTKDILELSGFTSVKEMLAADGGLDELYALSEKETGEYTFQDGVLTVDGEDAEAKLEGNSLTLSVEDETLTFKRK